MFSSSIRYDVSLIHFLTFNVINRLKLIRYVCICNGVKSTGKAVYVTAVLPYLILIFLLCIFSFIINELLINLELNLFLLYLSSWLNSRRISKWGLLFFSSCILKTLRLSMLERRCKKSIIHNNNIYFKKLIFINKGNSNIFYVRTR